MYERISETEMHMGQLNVLVVSGIRLPEGYLKGIAAVDPRISVRDGRKLFLQELRRTGRQDPIVDRLEAEFGPAPDRAVPEGPDSLDTLLAEAEVIFGVFLFPENLLSRAPNLKWIHIGAAAIDQYLQMEIFKSSVMLTTNKGAAAIAIAEHVLALVFMLAKNASRLLENKRNRRWERFITTELRDKTLNVIGLGAIGGEVTRLAKGVGMKVIATRRSASTREEGVHGVDVLYPLADLHWSLAQSDFVVLTAPLTAETHHMIGKAELLAMRPTAYLINVAKGAIVDESALVEALDSGLIAGAGLDVFERDPLPLDSRLWGLPNVILSPGLAGSTVQGRQRLLQLFGENLKRYLNGRPLLNVVDRHKDY